MGSGKTPLKKLCTLLSCIVKLTSTFLHLNYFTSLFNITLKRVVFGRNLTNIIMIQLYHHRQHWINHGFVFLIK